MGERRLIEITSEVCRLKSALDTMSYISTFNESDIYLLLKYAGSSRYRGLGLGEAIFAFSRDYLASKGIVVEYSADQFEGQVNIDGDKYRIVMAS